MSDKPKKPIGYKSPPTHTRFKSGVSGNPSGKRKRPPSQDEIILKILNEPVTIMLRGKPVKVSLMEAMLRKTVHAMLKDGSVRDLERLTHMFQVTKETDEEARARMKANADAVMEKIRVIFDRTVPDDPPRDTGE